MNDRDGNAPDPDAPTPENPNPGEFVEAPRPPVGTLKQSAAARIEADRLDTHLSAVGAVRSETAEFEGSVIAASAVGGDARIEMSAAGAVATTGDVRMDRSAAGVVAGRTVLAHETRTFLLAAAKVDGDVKTAFKGSDALLFGAVAGAAAGLMVGLVSALVGRR